MLTKKSPFLRWERNSIKTLVPVTIKEMDGLFVVVG